MQARPSCRLCLVVTADEALAHDARRLTPPNAWVVVVCAPETLSEILDSFLVRHIVLDARNTGGPEVHRVLTTKARSVPVSRSGRREATLALLSKICAEVGEPETTTAPAARVS